MTSILPAAIVFFVEICLLVAWWKAHRAGTGSARAICFLGFLLGQLYLLWELYLVQQTGKPTTGSAEQDALMLRLVLGVSIGGLFTIIGLFYLSFASYGRHASD